MARKRNSSGATLSLFGDDEAAAVKRDASPESASELPTGLDPEHYEYDDNRRLRELVGPWVRDKHRVLEHYVGITSAVRNKWVRNGPAGTTYIDLCSGPGAVRVRGSNVILPGSPLVAWRCSRARGSFTEVFVADAHPLIIADCRARLEDANAPVKWAIGPAVDTVKSTIAQLNPYSYHFAFFDPFNLEVLSFDVIERLASLPHIDILMHISLQDLNRNLRAYIERDPSPLDSFAPGWRQHVDVTRADEHVRGKIFDHWSGLLRSVGLPVAETRELISAERNQPLYWLAFAARNELAHSLWEKILRAGQPKQLDLQ